MDLANVDELAKGFKNVKCLVVRQTFLIES